MEDGQIFELSDGSEISSLHESEVEALRKSYDKVSGSIPRLTNIFANFSIFSSSPRN
jgi:hypothetical protein